MLQYIGGISLPDCKNGLGTRVDIENWQVPDKYFEPLLFADEMAERGSMASMPIWMEIPRKSWFGSARRYAPSSKGENGIPPKETRTRTMAGQDMLCVVH